MQSWRFGSFGFKVFSSMARVYEVEPQIEHTMDAWLIFLSELVALEWLMT